MKVIERELDPFGLLDLGTTIHLKFTKRERDFMRKAADLAGELRDYARMACGLQPTDDLDIEHDADLCFAEAAFRALADAGEWEVGP